MANAQAHHEDGQDFSTRAIWRTFWILLGITLVELTIGMFIAPHFPEKKYWFNALYGILTLAKAFYIIAEFMHLRHEIKNLIMTIGIPALLFIWFVLAFSLDGRSFNKLRNDYDPHYKEASMKKVGEPEKKAAPAHDGKTPGKE